MQHEVTLVEQRRDRFAQLEAEFGHAAMLGDATEIAVLERAGIARPPDLVLAVTGDDEDNLIISQIAKEGYGVPKAIARVNDPRNQQHFDLLGITRDGLRDVRAARRSSSTRCRSTVSCGCSSCAAKGSRSSRCRCVADSPAAGKRVAGLCAAGGLAARLGDAQRRRRDRGGRDGDPPRATRWSRSSSRAPRTELRRALVG